MLSGCFFTSLHFPICSQATDDDLHTSSSTGQYDSIIKNARILHPSNRVKKMSLIQKRDFNRKQRLGILESFLRFSDRYRRYTESVVEGVKPAIARCLCFFLLSPVASERSRKESNRSLSAVAKENHLAMELDDTVVSTMTAGPSFRDFVISLSLSLSLSLNLSRGYCLPHGSFCST
jgi:hypothetical protein